MKLAEVHNASGANPSCARIRRQREDGVWEDIGRTIVSLDGKKYYESYRDQCRISHEIKSIDDINSIEM